MVQASRKMYSFADKAFLVTGSTRGIGRAIAASLVNAGARVGIHGRDPKKVAALCRELSPELTVSVTADFEAPANAAGAVKSFFEQTGQLDGLVNNAGTGRAAAFRALKPEDWRTTLDVNLLAPASAAREAYIIMRKQGFGSIVNMASVSAHGPGKWMGADYAASKSALVSLTRSLAFEAARFGIRVNAVSPGMIETDMTSIIPAANRERLNIPIGRFGKPEEIATVVQFLLAQASSYITGQVLHVDGGMWMG